MNIYWAQMVFTVLAALGAGTLAVLAAAALAGVGEKLRRPGATIAVASLLLGNIASILYLGHPERIFAVFSNLSSALTQGAVMAVVSVAVAGYYLLQLMRKAEVGKAFHAVLLVLAVGMMVVMTRFYYMPDRPVREFFLYFFALVLLAGMLGSAVTAALAMMAKDAPQLRKYCTIGAVVSLVLAVTLLRGTFVAMSPMSSASSGYGGASTPSFLAPGGASGSVTTAPAGSNSAAPAEAGYGETPSFLQQDQQ